LYSNVQAFYNFNDTIPEYANRQFDLMNVCSGGDTYQDLLLVMPYLCPECQANFSCHQEDLVIRATEICTSICNEVNLTLYPDLNDTEPYEYGNAACDPQYFPIPSIPEAPACVAKGVSSIDTIEVSGIALKDISYAEDNSEATGTEFESGSGMVLMDSLMLAIFYATVVVLYI
jgi:hypothetical protein